MRTRGKGIGIVLALSIMAGMIGGCSAQTAEGSGENRLEAIRRRGTLQVVMEPYFAPNQFIDPSKSGAEQYVGSDVEFSKLIAQKLGVKLEIVPLEFTAVLSSISEGKYDLAISSLAYTPARAEAMILSDGYYFSTTSKGFGLLIRDKDKDTIKTAQDLADKTVVAQSGSLQEMFANEQILQKKELKRVSATTDGFLMIQEDKADACVVSKAMAQLYIDANPDSGLTIVEDFAFTLDKQYDGTRIGIPPGEEELAMEINRIIDEVVRSGQYVKWYEEYSDYAQKLGL